MSVLNPRSLVLHAALRFGMLLIAFLPAFSMAQLLKNGSFEVALQSGSTNAAWSVCMGDPDMQVLDGSGPGIFGIHTAPAQGQYYLGMLATDQGLSETIGQPFAVESGMFYYGNIEVFRSMAHQSWNGSGEVQIWGATDCNGLEELLWSSGPVANVDQWQDYPIAFTALANHTFIAIKVALENGTGEMTYLCLDDLRLYNAYFGFGFLDFQAMPTGGTANLIWETTALPDEVTFHVQWSKDGQAFVAIGSIPGGIGGTNFSYAYPLESDGRQFFRIAMVGIDGHTELSEVQEVIPGDDRVHVFPNPARDRVQVWVGDGAHAVEGCRLLDMTGRALESYRDMPNDGTALQLPDNLSSGCYLLEITVAGVRSTHRLLIGQ